MEEQKKYDLFDRYLRGELEQKELDSFLAQLESDEALKEEFDTYHYLVEGIREHEKQELKAFMAQRNKGEQKYIGSPWSKSFTYAAAAILLAFGLLYVVLDNQVKDQDVAVNDRIVVPKTPEPTQAPEGEKVQEAETPESVEPHVHTKTPVDTGSDMKDEGDEPQTPKKKDPLYYPEPGDPNRMAGSSKDDFPVKEDSRILDTLITLSIRMEKYEKQTIDSSGAAPGEERSITLKSEKILVQFWKSPINYKGYRFDGRKLVLFGLDSFSQVELKYRIVDPTLEVYDIYLVYGKLTVKLIDDNRYNAYIRETNPAILNELK